MFLDTRRRDKPWALVRFSIRACSALGSFNILTSKPLGISARHNSTVAKHTIQKNFVWEIWDITLQTHKCSSKCASQIIALLSVCGCICCRRVKCSTTGFKEKSPLARPIVCHHGTLVCERARKTTKRRSSHMTSLAIIPSGYQPPFLLD